MSGALNLLQQALGLTSDPVYLTVGGQQLTGWTSVVIGRSLEGFPSFFEFTATDAYPADGTRTNVNPGDPCQVMIGSDIVITGYVDRVGYKIHGGTQHELIIKGRGLCCDLVDCSADLSNAGVVGAQINNTDVHQLAVKLCQPFKIDVVYNSKTAPQHIDSIEIALGETPYEIIERAARFSAVLVYENEKGQLVIDDVGTQQMGSGFAQGVNVEDADAEFSMEDRFSDFTILWQSIDQYSQLNSSANFRASGNDNGVPRYRPKIIISEQWTPDFDFGQRRLNWEIARRYGRSQAVTILCDGWRDAAGTLWAINFQAPIALPALKVSDTWVIGAVTFRKDQNGTHAEVMLMPPTAFSPEPDIVKPFDRQIGNDLQSPSAPAGSETTAPSGGAGP